MDPNLFNQKTEENNLFQFHLDLAPTYMTQPTQEHSSPFSMQPQSQSYYSYYSDNTPTTLHETPGFSSPQLKPVTAASFQRKRFKTVGGPARPEEVPSPSFKSTGEADESELHEEDDDDEDESGSETDSNNESAESNKKRGKYKIYSDNEKSTILNFMMKHGMQKTLEIFSNNTHKITKRKLKSWVDSQHKVKGVKGRKTNDPNRDQVLYEWCAAFQSENGRTPTRKEATKKALELSEDPSFQASKGWLDKFSRKYNIEFTPLKIIPPKKKKTGQFLDGEPDSALSNSDASSIEGISPLLQAMQSMQPQQQATEYKPKEWSLGESMNPAYMQNEYEGDGNKISSFFSFGNQNNGIEGFGYEKKDTIPYLEQSHQQQPINLEINYQYGYPVNYQQNYPMNYQVNQEGTYHMSYPVNNQIPSEINGFFNTGINYQADTNTDDQMKLEYPY